MLTSKHALHPQRCTSCGKKIRTSMRNSDRHFFTPDAFLPKEAGKHHAMRANDLRFFAPILHLVISSQCQWMQPFFFHSLRCFKKPLPCIKTQGTNLKKTCAATAILAFHLGAAFPKWASGPTRKTRGAFNLGGAFPI